MVSTPSCSVLNELSKCYFAKRQWVEHAWLFRTLVGVWTFRCACCLSAVPAKQPAARGHVRVLNEVLLAGVLMNHSYLFFSN